MMGGGGIQPPSQEGYMRGLELDRDGMRPTWFESLFSERHARHVLSRRRFMGAVTGSALGAGLLWPAAVAGAASTSKLPKPTTNVVSLGGKDFHLTFFGPGIDPSSLTDFKGSVGVADVQGTGTASSPGGTTETLLFDTDMRFASGVYVGQDGAVHDGTFAFV
jgi:hypothetical protein